MKLGFLFLAVLVTLASSLWAMDAAFADEDGTATIQRSINSGSGGDHPGSILDGLIDLDEDLPGDAEHFVRTEPAMAAPVATPAGRLVREAPRFANAEPRLLLRPPSLG